MNNIYKFHFIKNGETVGVIYACDKKSAVNKFNLVLDRKNDNCGYDSIRFEEVLVKETLLT